MSTKPSPTTGVTLCRRIGYCALSTALLSLAACDSPRGDALAGSTSPPPHAEHTTAPPSGQTTGGDVLAQQISARLQACAYDGASITVSGTTLQPTGNAECIDLVSRIMRFTGLPQNFTVVEAPVANAAALVLVDDSNTPRRVIAFNRRFLETVKQTTGDHPWAPISIMAHEIGHHLSGHTILPGGSQPPIELEADKFSGFVLYRMGASLDDAQHAMSTLVPAFAPSRSHPQRSARLLAIAQGWMEACEQQAKTPCAAEQKPPTERALPVPPAHDNAPPAAIAALQPPMTSESRTDGPATTQAPPRAPIPGGTPSKFNRFVYDDYGLLDPDLVAGLEQRLFAHVQTHEVEIVTLLARDTQGMTASAYAQAMLRQLRVGKLDTGNGVVMVVAPELGETAIAMGPGVALQMQSVVESDQQRLQNFLHTGWPYCVKKGQCGVWTELLLEAPDHFAEDTRLVDWRISWFDLGEMLTSASTYARDSALSNADASLDPTWQKLLQITLEVEDMDVPTAGEGYFAPPEKGPAARLRTSDGQTLIAQVPASLAELMPSGALRQGQRYSAVLRASSLTGETPVFDLLSYVEIAY